MSRDRFVKFDEESERPTLEELHVDVSDYGGSMFSMTYLDNEKHRILVYLNGEFEKYGESHVRFIEIMLTSQVDVLTRNMDGPTNDIADGVARFIAIKHGGTLHENHFPSIKRPEEDKNRYVLKLQDSAEMEEALEEVRDFCREQQAKHGSVHDEEKLALAHGTIHRILRNLLQRIG